MFPGPVAGSGLEALERLAAESGADHLADEARALSERLGAGLFYVACVGQFKRGKSTLLNALLGEPVLPMGVTPVTAAVTIIRHGRRRAARVRFAAGDWQEISTGDLPSFVTEDQNPENRRGVVAVEVVVPCGLLADGMCLVDTPGIGSVFTGNTEATRAFVPHIDAALVVLGADPPLSADELALVAEIAKQCQSLLIVMNKADKLDDAEREVAAGFTRRILAERAGLGSCALFEVSAAERLAGQGPPRDWDRLTDALTSLARQSGSALVEAAGERGLTLLAARLRRHLDEEGGALLRPLEESKRRIELVRACVADAERSLNDIDHLLAAEQARLCRIFSATRLAFLERARPAARRELANAIGAVEDRRGPALRGKAVELAQEISKRWLDRWLSEAQPAAEALYVEATRRFVDLTNSFLDKLASSQDAALSALPHAMCPEPGFRARSRLYFTSLMYLTSRTPAGWILDLVRSRARQLAVLERQVGDYLDQLIVTNASRIENDLNDRVLESRRGLQSEIRASLTEVVSEAEGALARAMDYRNRGSQAIQVEAERIGRLSDRLQALGIADDSAASATSR